MSILVTRSPSYTYPLVEVEPLLPRLAVELDQPVQAQICFPAYVGEGEVRRLPLRRLNHLELRVPRDRSPSPRCQRRARDRRSVLKWAGLA